MRSPARMSRSLRHAAPAVRGADERVLLRGGVAAERQERFEQRPQRRLIGGQHLEGQPRKIVVGAADVERLHLERSAPVDHGVEDRREQLRVDQVPFGGDDGGCERWTAHNLIVIIEGLRGRPGGGVAR